MKKPTIYILYMKQALVGPLFCTLAILTVFYFRYKGTVIGNRFGAGTGPILLDNVRCIGNERSIADCPHKGWTNHNCDHTEDVSVSCGRSPVQFGN